MRAVRLSGGAGVVAAARRPASHTLLRQASRVAASPAIDAGRVTERSSPPSMTTLSQ